MHFPLISTFTAVLALLPAFSAAFANPLACTGICTNTHDPAIIRRTSDGRYYRFATGAQISIFSAPKITGPWSAQGSVLPSGGSSISNSGSKDAWAPDVHYDSAQGLYILYYSVSQFGTQISVIGAATSKTMDGGTWTDRGSTGVSSKTGDAYNAIDGNYISVGGTGYMTFGSFWGDIFQTKLNSNGLTKASGTPYQLELNATLPRPSEGGYVYKSGSYYYLFFSSGSCCGYDTTRPPKGSEYKIMVCRSKTVTGGYVDKKGTSCLSSGGTLVLGSHGNIYGPGGQGVYNDASNGPVLYYHYVDTKIGYSDGDKRLGINKIDFSSGWPVV